MPISKMNMLLIFKINRYILYRKTHNFHYIQKNNSEYQSCHLQSVVFWHTGLWRTQEFFRLGGSKIQLGQKAEGTVI
jgi:hypothetical protein